MAIVRLKKDGVGHPSQLAVILTSGGSGKEFFFYTWPPGKMTVGDTVEIETPDGWITFGTIERIEDASHVLEAFLYAPVIE